MENYDIAFSLGFSCAVSQSLREAGLQFASYPFDWTGSPDVQAAARVISSGFDGWLNREDMELWAVRRAPLYTHVYRNRRTGFGYPHDFPSAQTFKDLFPRVSEKYARRVRRLDSALAAGGKALAVYLELPIRPRAAEADILAARRILAEKYPQTDVGLIYFYLEDVGAPKAVALDGRTTVVAIGGRQLEHGQVSHIIDRHQLTAYLRENVAVRDIRSEAEREAYDAERSRARERKWGTGGIWRQTVNCMAYRLYRNLETYLEGTGLVPRERPIWFADGEQR